MNTKNIIFAQVHFLKDNHLEPCTPDNAFNIKLPPQRMLKIQMYFSNGERSGFMFNIGDSVTNNGYGKSNEQMLIYGPNKFGNHKSAEI